MSRCSSAAARCEAQRDIGLRCRSRASRGGTYTAGGYAVNIRHEATLPGPEAAVRRRRRAYRQRV